ncbi:developmental regulatory protein WetA [Aspergillus chevalieri]|uniref:Developmental regulatory protein wetA n=2 Tax=Aspergillus subgen. Aspergillus TaxID=2720874 RepID=A0A7R7ZJ36_ASPCH|nr:uncharacterized protein ACHE_10373S [Aspergillus chevalieri]AKR71452.1 WetA protein [Aspergillus glaucus]BCR82971.1 hypothetical protein ACHE_10373S [Aspergillus chevalieri]
MFAQQFDHSFNDIFNQYVDVESSSADGNKDVSFPSGDFDQLFPLDSLSSDCGALSSPTISPSNKRRQSPQPWSTPTQDLWSLPQETGAASSSSVDQGTFSFHDTVQPSAVSSLSLNLDAQSSSSSSRPAAAHGLSSTSLSTPPETPRKKVCTGSGITTPKSIRHHQDTGDRRRLLRKQSFSPSLTRSSRAQKARMAYSDASAPRFHNFSLHSTDDRLPLSPPPTDLLAQHENLSADNATNLNGSSDRFSGDPAEMPQQYDSSIFNQSPAISMPSPSASALARRQQKYMSQPNSTTLTSSPPSADEVFSSPHSSGSQSLSSWYSDSLAPSAFSFTPDLNHDAQQWWSPMASRIAQQHQSSYQPMLEAPTPQRPIANHDQHNDILQGGLMIQFDPSFDMPAPAEPSFPPSTMSSSAPAATQESQTYHPVSNTPQKYINPSFAASTPQIQHHTRSPSLSPKNNGASTSPKSGSTTATATPRTGTVMRTPHRRSYERKMSAPSNTPKSVKTTSPRGSNKSVSVSFVNFTPSDSKKILTGVAPSGSSKTKARREQEARDRRRKLSEAALKAVRNAGGDIDALEAVLC